MSAAPSSRSERATANSRSTSTPDERGGRLVHDQDRGRRADSALAISTICWSAIDRPRAGRSGSIVHAQPGEERRPRARASRSGRCCRSGAERLPAHRDVLRDRQVREQRRLLVDHRDAGGLGVGRVGEVDVDAVHRERAACRGGAPRRASSRSWTCRRRSPRPGRAPRRRTGGSETPWTAATAPKDLRDVADLEQRLSGLRIHPGLQIEMFQKLVVAGRYVTGGTPSTPACIRSQLRGNSWATGQPG